MKTKTRPKRFIHAAWAAGLILAGVLIMIILSLHKPPVRKQQPEARIPFVKTQTITVRPHPVIISGEGTVSFARTTGIAPQVSGRVVFVADNLVNGGRFKKGDRMFAIEKKDYQLAVTLARASVKKAESDLMETEELAVAAKREWEIEHPADGPDTPEPSPLVLKKPQRIAAQAALAAQQANLEKAALNLQRTNITAPYDCVVIEENIDEGQMVSPNQPVATVGAVDRVEIVVPLEKEKLAWFDIPGMNTTAGTGATVKVYATLAGQQMMRKGYVCRAHGKIDERTRMAKVVIRMDKPYDTFPPFYAGLFATTEIIGNTAAKAAYIPRPALHEGDRVWLVDDDNRLVFRPVTVSVTDPKTGQSLITSGLKDGDRLVISLLPAATEGMKVNPQPVAPDGVGEAAINAPAAGTDGPTVASRQRPSAKKDAPSPEKNAQPPAQDTPLPKEGVPSVLAKNKHGGWTIRGLQFAAYRTDLSDEDHQMLTPVAAYIKEKSSMKIEIRGHTDSSGNPRQNKTLSRQRADAVKQYLVAAGIDEKRLSSVGYGDTMPIASNKTTEGRALNRRVTLHPLDS
ncbi:MAG: efflux RND transporter periplasmic adaptor subunit [Thermodesulfobacteriota bacterium]|nr:efflux RND transporter periplasmic adaptor subunit [Thermodesulfobacteriota bacterium]